MAWVSVIGPSIEQVEYRLQEGAGCGHHQAGHHQRGAAVDPKAGRDDTQVDYRLAQERGLMWVGQGLHELGLDPESALTPEQFEAARAIMSGVHPATGEVLVKPKQAADPRAKVHAQPLLRALQSKAATRQVTLEELLARRPAAAKRVAQMAREQTSGLGAPAADQERGEDRSSSPHRPDAGV